MWLKIELGIYPGRRPGAATWLSCLLLVTLLFCVAGQQAAAAESQALASTSFSLRQYYLTSGFYNGAQADDSCAIGYHMASLWEFIDPSNHRYNPGNGGVREDSGQGPPTWLEGWVRTGYDNSVVNTPGQANCDGWASNGDSDYGSSVYLPSEWKAGKDLGIWKVGAWGCDLTLPVWCVADEVDGTGSCSAPLPLSCGQQVTGDTTGLPSHHESYIGVGWNESGPDVVYQLVLPAASAPYTITAAISNLSVDLDIFLMPAGGCRGRQQMAYGDTSATAVNVPAGTYYVVVDGYAGAAGSYTLDLACAPNPPSRVYLPLLIRSQ